MRESLGATVPSRLPSPFETRPHAIAQWAAERLQADLQAGKHTNLEHDFENTGGGKMLGVLVIRDVRGRLGFLRGASGTLGGSWRPLGFVPPLFDSEARETFWPAGQVLLAKKNTEIKDLEFGTTATALAAERREMLARHQYARDQLLAQHAANKAERARLRSSHGFCSDREHHRLSVQSQQDRRARKQLRAGHREEDRTLERRSDALAREVSDLKRDRTTLSNALLREIQDGYHIENFRGDSCSLSSLYAGAVPGGSGDCAAPKMFGYAWAHDLVPIALAEFWWGASPPGGGRHHAQYYPACRGKCGPLLAYMLQGLDHESPPLFASTIPKKNPLPTLYQDESILVVDKPASLLSVPGATPKHRDSVLTRLRTSCVKEQRPLHVHRLDLDTSGVLLFARTPEMHRLMQRLFAERLVDKRYVAWLSGPVKSDRGTISLPLRLDVEDRPRQVVDPIRGKEAISDYVVLQRRGDFTKVAFFPKTGRSHQLRVHAAHPAGLNAPIVGDRLYGKSGPRMYLHAQRLSFQHPLTAEAIEICSPIPCEFSNLCE